MPDLIEQLSRYGTALEVHQSEGVSQAMRPEERRPTRRYRPLLAVAATILLVGLAVGAVALSTQRDTARIATGPTTSAPAPTMGVALNRPEALAVAPDGSLLIANQGTDQILRRTSDGVLTVVAGNPTGGATGDGGAAVDASLNRPAGMAVGRDGTIYFAEPSNNRVRKVTPDGVITTFAGNGSTGPGSVDVRATDTAVVQPFAVALRADGGLYVIDDAGVQVVSPEGILTTVIPQGMSTITGDGAPTAFDPDAIAVDQAGNLFVATYTIKYLIEFSPTGRMLHRWDNTYVTQSGLATAPDGSVLVAEYGGFTIRSVRDGKMTTVADFLKDPLPGLSGTFRPSGVAVASDGTVYAATDGVSGTTSAPALLVFRPNSAPRLLTTTGEQPNVVTGPPDARSTPPVDPGSDSPMQHAERVRQVQALVVLFAIPLALAFVLGLFVRRSGWLWLIPPALAIAFAILGGSRSAILPRLVGGLVWAMLIDLGIDAGSYFRRRRAKRRRARSLVG